MQNNHQRIRVLDVSRLVAALFVVLFHISSGTNYVLNMGYLSVDYFFVLSGFVLARNIFEIQTMSDSFFFVKKRFVRLFPNTALSLVATFAVSSCIWFFGSRASEVWQNFSFKSIIGYLSFMSIFVPKSISLNFPIWSLSSEFISNLFFAFQRLGSRNQRKKLYFLCALPICFYITSMDSITPAFEPTWLEPIIRTCSGLAIGCLLYQFFAKMAYPLIKAGVLVLSGLLMLTSEVELGFQIFSCLVIKFLVVHSDRIERRCLQALLNFSGELSFLIYLLHVPILSCVDLLLLKSKISISSQLYIQAPIQLLIVLLFTSIYLSIRKSLKFMVVRK